MIRRVLVAIALAACAGAYGLAVERATFILIDGERKSGTVVFHTPARENLVNNYLNLGTDDGKEMTFPVDQVAVIDFAGGRPATAELTALPAGDGTHLLVLRDGNAQQGHLLNLVDGDTVIWRTLGFISIPIAPVPRSITTRTAPALGVAVRAVWQRAE
jgi:hypothetical protein